jgi:hypothetical protein
MTPQVLESKELAAMVFFQGNWPLGANFFLGVTLGVTGFVSSGSLSSHLIPQSFASSHSPGHKPTNSNGLGMTGNYTHTRPETQRQQIEQAIRKWPASLRYTLERVGGGQR